jgi:alkylation response protein AidB-like acyl-CoA dehydrogenase
VTAQFRRTIREWCQEYIPRHWQEDLLNAPRADYVDFQRKWLATLREARLAVPHWPAEWGGGYSAEEQIIIFQELARARAPRLSLFVIGLHHAAATLRSAGTQQQIDRHIGAILDGEVWCQAFSEPSAGSDLASLRTRAVRDGSDYLVTGQKIWSSMADFADYALLLARTGAGDEKHRGISYFILDMHSPGVEVRTTRQSTGESEFCEIFLSDVRVPAENLIGAEGQGWSIAQVTLGEERGVTVVELAERLYFRILDLARELGNPPGETPGWESSRTELARSEVTQAEVAPLLERVSVIRAMSRGLALRPDRGGQDIDISVLKIMYSELLQDVARVGSRLLVPESIYDRGYVTGGGWETGSWFGDLVGSWTWTISGGTNQIHRNILARRGLGLRKAS